MKAVATPVAAADELEATIARVAGKSDGGLLILNDVFTSLNRESIVHLAARYKLPAVYPYRYFAPAGGLICYGVDISDLFHRAGQYADRILKGEKPTDLPVQQPTKFELVINLKTAKALGLAVPQSLLVAADEVIE